METTTYKTEEDICNEIIRLIHRADWAWCSGVNLDPNGCLEVDYRGDNGHKVPALRHLNPGIDATKAEIEKLVYEAAHNMYQNLRARYLAKRMIVDVDRAYRSLDLGWTTSEERAAMIAEATGINAEYNDELRYCDYESGGVRLRVIDYMEGRIDVASLVFAGDEQIADYTPIYGEYPSGPDGEEGRLTFHGISDDYFRWVWTMHD